MKSEAPSVRPNAGVLLLSLSLLLFELTLIRVYSTILFYHFAFMAVSVAMLGLAASGITVNLYPHWFAEARLTVWAFRWSLLYAVSMPVVVYVVFHIPVNAYLAPNLIAGKLTLIYLLSAVPFYLAGLVLAGVFTAMSDRFGSLYAWDLAGAGLGAVAMLPLMNLVGGESAAFFIAALAGLAAVCFAVGNRRWMALGAALVITAFGLLNPALGVLRIVYSKGMPVRNLMVAYNRWNSISRVMAIPFRPGTDAVYTWCPSPNYPLPIMEHWSLMIDDGAATPVLPFNGIDLDTVEYLKYDLTSMGHRLRGGGNTLVIGCGGGRDVLTGLLFNARHIDAVDVNPLIFDAMNHALADFNGRLYFHPRVTPYLAEGRAFARRNPEKYDLIQVAMIDTWAATVAGAYALSENTLYTVEAFQDFLNALTPDGILTFTRFYFTPPRQTLRLVSLFLEAARRMNIPHPDSCILVGKYESLATVLFKRKPFTESEIARFKADLTDLGFDLVYAPDERPEKFFRSLVGMPDRDEFYRRYPFDVRPPVDDRPFFFNMLKIKDFLRALELREGQRFNYYATYTLVMVFILSMVATVVTLILPMMARAAPSLILRRAGWMPVYFILIGLAYIMIEIALLQRFTLLLEHPAQAAAAVIAGLLVSSGAGSLYFHRTVKRPRSVRVPKAAFAAAVGILLVQVVWGDALIHAVLGWHLATKAVLAAVLVIPLGAAMGIPLPAGMAQVAGRSREMVAWCWALNGAASVIASSLAVLVAMARGFSYVLGLGLVCYLGAFGVWLWNQRYAAGPEAGRRSSLSERASAA